MPFVPKGVLQEFGVNRLSRGGLYGAGNGEFCTLFHTRMGPSFTGDAVLYLSDTPCRELYFLGTCGLLRRTPGIKIGSLVSPSRCYAQESFTSLLSDPTSTGIATSPDLLLYQELINFGGAEDSKYSGNRLADSCSGDLQAANHGPADGGAATSAVSPAHRMFIEEVTGISAGSLKLQPEKIGEWRERGVQVVDLESAAFFAAARRIERSAAALMVVSDIVGENPWHQESDRELVSGSLRNAARILCEIISKKQSD
jgi:purine-nucleoside phosphorylase